ncbi:MAG: transposase [Alphaproteobacteria bacterium]|nr:transposase [Alphaproteobacteria bacterium]
MSIISRPYFWDEQAAHAKLEEIVWPNGPVCTRCGATDRIGAVTGKGARAGLKFCCRCRKQFRATVGTIFEGSHVPLHKWFQACFLLSAASGAISPYQLHLRLEVTNKTALGIVNRVAWIIGSASSSAFDGCQALASRGQAPSCSQRPARRRPGRGPNAVGWDELPWMQFPRRPKRQFLRFVETVEEFGCVEDEARFEHLLSMIGTNPVNRPRMILKASSGAPMAVGFARTARGNLERATV